MDEDTQRRIDSLRQLGIGNLGDLSIEVVLHGTNEGRVFTADLGGDLIWSLYNTFQQVGLIQGLLIHFIDKAIRDELREENILDPESAVDDIWLKLGHLLTGGKISKGKPPTLDTVLGFTYQLLHSKVINYAQAANIARVLLEDNDITPEAWRKRLARFVVKQELDPVEARRGRPKNPDE